MRRIMIVEIHTNHNAKEATDFWHNPNFTTPLSHPNAGLEGIGMRREQAGRRPVLTVSFMGLLDGCSLTPVYRLSCVSASGQEFPQP